MNRRIAAAIAALGAAATITVAAGCGSDSASVPTGEELKGTYVIAGEGYADGKPQKWDNPDSTMVIDMANGQAFAGSKSYVNGEGQKQSYTVNGVIASDGDILITEPDAFFEGTYADGVITGQYAEMGDDATAANITYTKK
jgi:hypothetical protein